MIILAIDQLYDFVDIDYGDDVNVDYIDCIDYVDCMVYIILIVSIILIVLNIESLVVVPISQASADQRAGRAGRVRSGLSTLKNYFYKLHFAKKKLIEKKPIFFSQGRHTDCTQVSAALHCICCYFSVLYQFNEYFVGPVRVHTYMSFLILSLFKIFFQRTTFITFLQQLFLKCKGSLDHTTM